MAQATVAFRKALAGLTTEEIAEKAKEARLAAIVSVRLYDNTEYATQTETIDGNLVHHMDLFYKSICGKGWSEIMGALQRKVLPLDGNPRDRLLLDGLNLRR